MTAPRFPHRVFECHECGHQWIDHGNELENKFANGKCSMCIVCEKARVQAETETLTRPNPGLRD